MSEDIGVAMMVERLGNEVGRLADAVEKMVVAPGSTPTNSAMVPCPWYQRGAHCHYTDEWFPSHCDFHCKLQRVQHQ